MNFTHIDAHVSTTIYVKNANIVMNFIKLSLQIVELVKCIEKKIIWLKIQYAKRMSQSYLFIYLK